MPEMTGVAGLGKQRYHHQMDDLKHSKKNQPERVKHQLELSVKDLPMELSIDELPIF